MSLRPKLNWTKFAWFFSSKIERNQCSYGFFVSFFNSFIHFYLAIDNSNKIHSWWMDISKQFLFSAFQWNARSSMIRTFSFAFNQCDYYAWTGNRCHNKTINGSNEFLIRFAFEVATSILWTHQFFLMNFNVIPKLFANGSAWFDLTQSNLTRLDPTRPKSGHSWQSQVIIITNGRRWSER